jgi:hypothetical protein
MKLYCYIVTHDTGFSPNPFHGYCTLACCKPTIRRTAKEGDWVVGLTPIHVLARLSRMQLINPLNRSLRDFPALSELRSA